MQPTQLSQFLQASHFLMFLTLRSNHHSVLSMTEAPLPKYNISFSLSVSILHSKHNAYLSINDKVIISARHLHVDKVIGASLHA